jgi:hypothetical protein
VQRRCSVRVLASLGKEIVVSVVQRILLQQNQSTQLAEVEILSTYLVTACHDDIVPFLVDRVHSFGIRSLRERVSPGTSTSVLF